MSLSNPSKGPVLSSSKGPALSLSKGFTIVEVMMASVILVVGFMAMITCITIGSEMLATARRQTIASQLIVHEIDQLRLNSWTTVSALSSSTTWSAAFTYAVGDTVRYRGGRFRCIQAHAGSASLTPPVSPSYWTAYMAYDSSATYALGEIVSSGGSWYRYSNATSSSGNAPPSATYWKSYEGPMPTSVADGVSFSVTRSVQDVTTDLREITVVVSWTKSGTSAAASTPTAGTWVDRLAFYRPSRISRTYSRSMTTTIGKYGINLGYQR